MLHLAAALFLAGQTVIGDPAVDDLNSGARELDRGDVADGLALTEKAMESDDLSIWEKAAAYNNTCVGFLRLKLYEQAKANCERAVAINDENWRFLNNRANAHLGLGQIDAAIADYIAALQLNPRSDIVRRNLFIAFDRKLWSDAIEAPEREET